ncbi:MAG: pyruvate dehydrogenase (acetyl-transferring) component subunit alpha [Pseudonocardiales bacterium]|nr:pyruvate dehydrogenase (acetyl-transferring) component subunit alpha [Pseudonocardiales bacterium]
MDDLQAVAVPETGVLLEMYRRMLRIRRFDERAVDRHGKGEIPGPMHTSIGQEATAVGACLAVNEDDYMTGTHRSHGHPIAKGVGLDALMAELMGKGSGVCGGKGGSMHLADFSVGSLGESGIVASAMPVAVGAALSAQIRGSGQVVICFFGDGAVNEGAFHESLNLAAVWHLPVIFVCENNGYGITTPVDAASAVPVVADRAAAYAMPGVRLDGQDVLAVYGSVREAAERARRGEGPSLIEAMTYRFREHSEMGSNFSFGPYRSDEEIAEWLERDPLVLFRTAVLEAGLIPAVELDEIETEVDAEAAAAVKFARRSDFPPPEQAYVGLYLDERREPASLELDYA